VIEETASCPRLVASERVLTVWVHPDAVMTVPRSEWIWCLNYQNEHDRGDVMCTDREMASSIAESYRYLVMECTKDEAWHRILKLRAAIKMHDKP
jgi:hypothetical protein